MEIDTERLRSGAQPSGGVGRVEGHRGRYRRSLHDRCSLIVRVHDVLGGHSWVIALSAADAGHAMNRPDLGQQSRSLPW